MTKAATKKTEKTVKELTIEQAEKIVADKKAREAKELREKMQKLGVEFEKLVQEFCEKNKVKRVFVPSITELNKITVSEYLFPKNK